MDKKATINISTRGIILIIIAIVLLLLLLGLIRYLSEEVDVRADEFGRYGSKPIAVISSPSPMETYTIFQILAFDGSKSYDRYDKIVGYFWDFNSDGFVDSEKDIEQYSYWEPGEYNVSLKVANSLGAIGSTNEIIRVVTNNRKIADLENSLFLIRDNDRTNNETILRLIPVTTWYDYSGLHSIPYYVYYVNDSSSSLELAKVEEIMDKYGKKHAYVFDDSLIQCNELSCSMPAGIKCCDLSGDKNFTKVGDKIDQLYFDFWDLYEYVILIDPTQKDDHLISALFAAFYNSPLMFVGDSNLDDFYKRKIRNNETGIPLTVRVYTIPRFDGFDLSVREFITNNSLDYKSYSGYELRTGNVNRIIRLNSNVTIKR